MTVNKSKGILLSSLAALGVVYGDIGTSPLYAISEIFFGHASAHIARASILGVISTVFWALTLVINFKYVLLVLRADNDGEGGVFSLYSLVNKLKAKGKATVATLLIIGAGLLFGDGIITPAISVISAVEGIKIVTSAFTPYIPIITVIILTCLFVIQRQGTAKVGQLFGPIIVVWFFSIGLLGLSQIIKQPEILIALNPYYAFNFLISNPIMTILFTLGAVVLTLTGGEAMYADMGHFGRLPIRLSWFSLVYPALILNYFGQGAFMLSGQTVQYGNIFFSMVPTALILPMVILATMATIIASQALISGAFSLASQAVSLGLFPYLKIVHTHKDHEGQIYVPFINWSLYIGCVLLVINFKSSNRLASAYGLAESGVMLATSLGMVYVSRFLWKWRWLKTLAVFIPLMMIDFIFVSANSLKFVEGGYIPLMIGLCILLLMKIWEWGRNHVRKTYATYPVMSVKDLIEIKQKQVTNLDRSIIILTPRFISSMTDKVPLLMQIVKDRHSILSKHIILLTVVIEKEPHVAERFEVKKLFNDNIKGSVTSVKVRFGFMEDPNVENVLEVMAKNKNIDMNEDPSKWILYALHERVHLTEKIKGEDRFRHNLYRILEKNGTTADKYFGLGDNYPLIIEVLPVYI